MFTVDVKQQYNNNINLLYTGRFFHWYMLDESICDFHWYMLDESICDFHWYMLDESICHFRGIRSIISLLFYFRWKTLLANSVDPDQMPHYMASDLGIHCLPITLLLFPGKNELNYTMSFRGKRNVKKKTVLIQVLFQNFFEG